MVELAIYAHFLSSVTMQSTMENFWAIWDVSGSCCKLSYFWLNHTLVGRCSKKYQKYQSCKKAWSTLLEQSEVIRLSYFFNGMKINDLCQGKAIIENIPTFLNQHDNMLFSYNRRKWYSVFERFQAKRFFCALNSCDFVILLNLKKKIKKKQKKNWNIKSILPNCKKIKFGKFSRNPTCP